MIVFILLCITHFNMFQHTIPQFVVGYSPDSYAETCREFMIWSDIRKPRTYTDCDYIVRIIRRELFIFPAQKKILPAEERRTEDI
jgi:hypothetical protein